uniref:Uncharacterized protein n=1 Tax=Cacopsylla melanoneura TaxID=428564 RepID=A0A8D9EBH3_9HEMI
MISIITTAKIDRTIHILLYSYSQQDNGLSFFFLGVFLMLFIFLTLGFHFVARLVNNNDRYSCNICLFCDYISTTNDTLAIFSLILASLQAGRILVNCTLDTGTKIQ